MEIHFHDPSEAPLPPGETRISAVRAEPWPDGRRVSVEVEITPFQQRPNLHISIHLFRNPPKLLDAILNVLKSVVTIFVGVIMFWYGNIILQFMSRSILPATQLPSWVLYAVLPLSATLIVYEGITDLIGYESDRNDPDREEVEGA